MILFCMAWLLDIWCLKLAIIGRYMALKCKGLLSTVSSPSPSRSTVPNFDIMLQINVHWKINQGTNCIPYNFVNCVLWITSVFSKGWYISLLWLPRCSFWVGRSSLTNCHYVLVLRDVPFNKVTEVKKKRNIMFNISSPINNWTKPRCEGNPKWNINNNK